MQTKLARWWTGPDNQEVGLEAATLQRVRNSSLVESGRADNIPGIKSATDAMGWRPHPSTAMHGKGGGLIGRGASPGRGSHSASRGGAQASANAGMSSAEWRCESATP